MVGKFGGAYRKDKVTEERNLFVNFCCLLALANREIIILCNQSGAMPVLGQWIEFFCFGSLPYVNNQDQTRCRRVSVQDPGADRAAAEMPKNRGVSFGLTRRPRRALSRRRRAWRRRRAPAVSSAPGRAAAAPCRSWCTA